MKTIKWVSSWLFSLLLALGTSAASVSTGDLGANVVSAGGAYTWSPTVSSLTNSLPATLAVSYGLWNDPAVTVHAYVNGTEVGSFVAQNGYYDPGPTTNTFTITGLLVEGVNTIKLDGLGASSGDYVIGSIEVDYNIPLPATNPPVTVTNPPATNGPVDGPFIRKGTSVLHYMTHTPLTPTDVGSSVSAVVELSAKEQGNAAQEKFDFTATALAPNTEYVLLIARDDLDASSAGTFTTDKQGRARVSAMRQANGQGKSKKPSSLIVFPVTDIRAVGIQNAAIQTLALASIDASPRFQYLLKRNLTPADTNSTAAGSISLQGNAEGISFRLLAGGLSVSNAYSLALNSNVVETVTADVNGRVGITGWPASAPALLDVRSLSLMDGSGNVVLNTTLPK